MSISKFKNLYIGESKLHGKGIFAKDIIKRHSFITRFSGHIKFKINKNKRDALSHPYWVGLKKHTWIEPTKPQMFLNHSCNPNANTKGLTVIAIRNIQKDEEIVIDYSLIEGDGRWEMRCYCDAKNCRNIIRSIQYLPKSTFKKYLPYIPAYFKKLYLNESPKYVNR